MNKIFILIMFLGNLSIAANITSGEEAAPITSERISNSVEELLAFGKFSDAKQFLEKIIVFFNNEHPEYIKISCILANVYMHMGDYEKSIEIYERYFKSGSKVLENDPFLVVVFNNIANLMLAMGRYDDALSYCEQALLKNKAPDET